MGTFFNFEEDAKNDSWESYSRNIEKRSAKRLNCGNMSEKQFSSGANSSCFVTV